jgi:hypothetical protein
MVRVDSDGADDGLPRKGMVLLLMLVVADV